VRLYTKPGTFKEYPYLTMAFPLASIVLLGLCIALPLRLGVHLQALYLTWSPRSSSAPFFCSCSLSLYTYIGAAAVPCR